MSNLQFLSKLTEKAVAQQAVSHVITHGLLPVLQSAYRPLHSTETALLRVHNDILLNMNKQQVTLLVFLDLSAAFDTNDHSVLLRPLETKLGFTGTALEWFKSYLSGRFQQVVIDMQLLISLTWTSVYLKGPVSDRCFFPFTRPHYLIL